MREEAKVGGMRLTLLQVFCRSPVVCPIFKLDLNVL